MRMSEKCQYNNNNSYNPLTSRRTDGDKNEPLVTSVDPASLQPRIKHVLIPWLKRILTHSNANES